MTDTAINAGGAAVYAGSKLMDSTWSRALVASKSKLMKATVRDTDVSPPLEPFIPEMEIPGLSAGVKTSVLHSVVPSPLSPMPGRMGVDLLIDPVSTGWYRARRVLGHVISFISKIQAKIGTIKNIRSGSCSETEFLTESRGSCQILKPEQLRIQHAGVDITVK